MEWNTKWNMGMEYEMEYGIGIWEWNMGMEYKMKYKKCNGLSAICYLNKATTSAGGIALPISRVATTRPVGKWKWLSP